MEISKEKKVLVLLTTLTAILAVFVLFALMHSDYSIMTTLIMLCMAICLDVTASFYREYNLRHPRKKEFSSL